MEHYIPYQCVTMKRYFLLLFLLCAVPLQAETIYQGRVLLPDGKAAEGTDVAFLQYHFDDENDIGWQVKAIITSDTNGQWQVKVGDKGDATPGDSTAQASTQASTIVAFKAGFGLAWQNIFSSSKGPFTLKLAPPGRRKLTVIDTAGKAISDASVAIAMLQDSNNAMESRYVSLPENLRKRWMQKTDATGTLVLIGVPPNYSTNLKVSAPGLVSLSIYERTGTGDLRIALPRAIKIKVRLVPEPGVTLSPSARKLALNATDEKNNISWGSGVLVTDANGEFTIDDAAPGTATVYSSSKSEARDIGFLPQIEGKVDIKGDKAEQEIQIPLKSLRAVTVTGKVTGEKGEPLKGATIYGTGAGLANYERQLARTEEDGTYSFQAPEGETKVRVLTAPQGYSSSEGYSTQSVKVAVGASGPIAGPDFVLSKAVSLTVSVTGGNGKPSAGAKVLVATGDLNFYYNSQTLYTSADGTLTIPHINPKQALKLRAHTATAMSPTVEVNLPQQKSVTLTLKENGGVKLRGRVVNQHGQAVKNAAVQINVMRGRQGGVEATYRTGADGRFASAMLWPDGDFSLFVTAEDHIPARSTTWRGGAAQAHQFNPLTLVHLDGVVSGIVRDGAGRAVPGARVWARGAFHETKQQQVSRFSDAQGRFRLEGLASGPLIICAEKAGHPVGAAWHDDTPNLVVQTGLYKGGPSAKMPNVESDSAAQRVALRYLEPAIAQSKKEKDPNAAYTTGTLLGYLARVDTNRAVQLADSKEVRDKLFMELGNTAVNRTPPDVRGALARWNNIKDPMARSYSVIFGLRQVAKTQPGAVKTALPQALAMARAVPEVSYRLIMLAKVAGLMNRVERGSGDALLQETVAAAQKLTNNEYEGYARAEVAAELVTQNFEGAWKLIEATKGESEKSRYIGMLAYRLAPVDADRSVKFVRENLSEWNQGYRLPALCAAIAPHDLPKAEALAATLKNNEKMRALAWMAEAIAPVSRTKAYNRATLLRLWNEAIKAGQATISEQRFQYSNGDTELMLVIAQGRQWGAKDVDAIALRAFAARPMRESNAWDVGSQNAERDAAYARALLHASPVLGRDYARTLLTAWRATSKNEGTTMGQFVSLALAIDPALADEILRTAPAAQKVGYATSAAAYALSSPQQRLDRLRSRSGFAVPSDDD